MAVGWEEMKVSLLCICLLLVHHIAITILFTLPTYSSFPSFQDPIHYNHAPAPFQPPDNLDNPSKLHPVNVHHHAWTYLPAELVELKSWVGPHRWILAFAYYMYEKVSGLNGVSE